MPYRTFRWTAASALLLGMFGCRTATADAPPPQAGVLTAVLEATSAPDVEFGLINDIDVDGRGRIYVGDGFGQVVVLDSAGHFLRRIGGQGEGPGEFESVLGVSLLPRDSLLVFDFGQARVTVYAPDADRPAYTAGIWRGSMFPAEVHRTANRRLLTLYRGTFQVDDGRDGEDSRLEVLRLLEPDGSLIRDSVLTVRERESLHMIENGISTGVFRYPYARRTVLRMGRDGNLYHVWTDSLAVHVVAPDGRPLRVIRPQVEATPRRIDRGEKEALVERYTGQGGASEADVRAMIDRKRVTTWPLLHDFILDDHDRLWLAFLPRTGGPVDWVGFDHDGQRVASFQLPDNVKVRRFRGDRLYADVKDELDVQTVAVYRLVSDSAEPAVAPGEPEAGG